MTPYLSAWQANEAQGTAVVMMLVALALAAVFGWLVIPVLMDRKFVTWCRWGYMAWMVMAAFVVLIWRLQ